MLNLSKIIENFVEFRHEVIVRRTKFELRKAEERAHILEGLIIASDNIDEVIEMDTSQFIGVSDDGLYFTKKGNLLADSPSKMEKLFANCKSIIAIHSEKEEIVEANEQAFREKYGEDIPAKFHPIIRSVEGCYEATKRAIELAKKHNARLHILHLTTEAEVHLFQNDIPLKEKKITTEVSVQHLWISDKDYESLGLPIKWIPAIKTVQDMIAIFKALLEDHSVNTFKKLVHKTLHEHNQPYHQSI